MSNPVQETLKNTETRLGLLLSTLFIVLPFGQHLLVNMALLAILLHSLFSLKGQDWVAALRSPLFVLPFILVAYHALSIFWAHNVDDGLFKLNLKLGLVFIPLVIAANARYISSKLQQHLLHVFVIGNVGAALFMIIWAIIRALNQGAWFYTNPGSDYKRYYFLYVALSEPLMHPGYISTYIGVALLTCIYFILKKGTKNKLWYYVALLFLFITLILLQGRINILSFFAVVGIGALAMAIYQRAYKWLLLPLVPVVLLAVFIVFASPDTRKRYLEMPDISYDISGNEFNSATYRLAEWLCASDVISQHPIIGTGLGDNHKALMQAYKNREFWKGLEHRFNAHNQYLETTIATGFIGLGLLLALVLGYGGLAFRQKNYLVLCALLFFALSMLTESMLERVWAVNLFAVFFSVMLIQEEQSTSAD